MSFIPVPVAPNVKRLYAGSRLHYRVPAGTHRSLMLYIGNAAALGLQAGVTAASLLQGTGDDAGRACIRFGATGDRVLRAFNRDCLTLRLPWHPDTMNALLFPEQSKPCPLEILSSTPETLIFQLPGQSGGSTSPVHQPVPPSRPAPSALPSAPSAEEPAELTLLTLQKLVKAAAKDPRSAGAQRLHRLAESLDIIPREYASPTTLAGAVWRAHEKMRRNP